ncbi:MAG: DNA primase [Pseudomonadota bacterium]
MPGKIPKQFIDDLIGRVDIVDVIGKRVQLKKAGREYKACCPFHDEKTPSFTVSATKQFYHCFGCGAHGTALGFLMEHDRLNFVDAVEALAQDLGLEVPREGGDAPVRPRTSYYEIMERVAGFYSQTLKNDTRAVEYLKNRGLTGEVAAEFQLGFVPDGWDTVLKRFGDSPEAVARLEAVGLVKRREGGRDGHYDRFRDRIMFPIRDPRGRVIAFGGRVLDKGEPKYLNSPETPLFHKGRELYGLYEIRQARQDFSRLLVVEGYMDVIGLAQAGIRNAVATLGTATTVEHLRACFQLTQEVVFCFDGDRAGRAAAWRALENSLSGLRDDRQLSFLFLPDGEDPDSLIRKEGRPAFERRLDDALPLSEFVVERLTSELDTASIDGRARLAAAARPVFNRIPEGVFRELLNDRLADAVQMAPERLATLITDPEPARARPARRSPKRRVSAGRGNLVRQAVSLLMNYPAVAGRITVPEELPAVDKAGVPLLCSLIKDLREHADTLTATVVERWRDDDAGPHLETLAAVEVLVDETGATAELEQILLNLVRQHGPAQRISALLEKASLTELGLEEKQELKALLEARAAASKERPKDLN